MRNLFLSALFLFSGLQVKAEHDTTILVGVVPVDFRFPGNPVAGAILVLPGWNFGRSDVCNKSAFCEEAAKRGYILVLPEMLKSVYSSELFPETRNDWRRYPTLKWITDTLIPFCRKQFSVFNSGGKNFLYGISTGARGVALVAENTGSLFLAGAALSGDYDQTLMPADRLMTGYYGSYEQFKSRWEGTDNPALHSDRLKTALYLAHGKRDAVVPCQQSIGFSEKIRRENPALGHQLALCDTCGHNYTFWNSQNKAVFEFYFTAKALRR
ncbi:MAG: alpha/beta hydrolase [Bacteroidetes bacterium]|nr:alpha/beta hydrolase [Bacteroidota bacterium]